MIKIKATTADFVSAYDRIFTLDTCYLNIYFFVDELYAKAIVSLSASLIDIKNTFINKF
jgi:hypothetical protein